MRCMQNMFFKLDQFLYVIYDVDLTSFVDSSYFLLRCFPWPSSQKNEVGFNILSFHSMGCSYDV